MSKFCSGGSVVADKINKTLNVLLKVFESQVKLDTIITHKLKEYPSPLQENMNLVKNHQLIQDTLTMIEGRPGPYVKEVLFPGSLEKILEIFVVIRWSHSSK